MKYEFEKYLKIHLQKEIDYNKKELKEKNKEIALSIMYPMIVNMKAFDLDENNMNAILSDFKKIYKISR